MIASSTTEKPMNRNATKFARSTRLLPAGLLLAALGACAGPERTPHQPIKGVDTERNDVQNPHDETAPRREDDGTRR
jgi:hypothetical protein